MWSYDLNGPAKQEFRLVPDPALINPLYKNTLDQIHQVGGTDKYNDMKLHRIERI